MSFSSFLKIFLNITFLGFLCFKHSFRFSNFNTSRTPHKEICATVIVILNNSMAFYFLQEAEAEF